MASTHASVLRQAILGQAASYPEGESAVPPPSGDMMSWERVGEADPASAVVRPPGLVPMSRSAAGHAGHMKLLFDNAPVAMAMFDTEMRYLLANHRWLEDFKLTNVDVTGRSQYELFPALHPGWRHVYERALGGQIVRSDRDSITQDGRPVVYRWEVRPWRHVDSVIGGVMISCERLYTVGAAPGSPAEKAHAGMEGEGLWQSPLPILAMTAEGRIVKASKGVAGTLRAESADGGLLPFWQAFAPAEHQEVLRRHVLASLHSVLSDGRAYTVIFTEAGPEPATTPSQWLVSRLDGTAAGTRDDLALVIGLPGLAPFAPSERDAELHDLTEQLTRMQAAIKDSADATSVARQREARLRAVLELAPCGFVVLDDHARPIYHNAHVGLLLGREIREDCSIEAWLSAGARDEVHHAEISRCWTEGVWRKHLTLPLALTAADGQLKEIEMRPVSLPGGGLLVMMQDVTESRRSEEMLRATEAKYRTLVHESPVPIILADRSSAIFDVNPAAESLLGHTRADLRRMSLDRWLDADSLAARAGKLREMQERGERSATVQVRVIHRGGESSPADLRLSMVTDTAGQLLFSIHFLTPLAEQHPVHAAAPVAASVIAPPRTQTHSHTQALLLLTTDMHGRIQEWSDDATERFGYERGEIVGRGLHTLFRPSDATGFYAGMLALGTGGADERNTVDWAFFHKTDGRQSGPFVLQRHDESALAISLLEEITVFSTATAPDEAAPAVGADAEAAGSGNAPAAAAPTGKSPADLPSPPASAKPTPEDLSRERLLLGETHHRVKNHLQIITSMLNLQMSTLHNDEARDALRSSQNRVRSIAALHQHLYQLATGAATDFRTFATGLVAHLRECYEVGEDRVTVELAVPDGPIPEEWLMPLALSLNEMVSNAFKHAFPNSRKGSMCVTLAWGERKGELTVVDDGVGLPSGFTHHDSTGLGLKILRVFAGQIGGEVKIDSAPGDGALFQLTFSMGADDAPKEQEVPAVESAPANAERSQQ